MREHIGEMDYLRLSTYSMLITLKLNRQLLVFGGNQPYYKVRQCRVVTKCDSYIYYKVRQPVMAKCDSYFITKCYKVITKCDRYYKVRQSYYKVRQGHYKVRQLFYYKVQQGHYKVQWVLQSATRLLQSATVQRQ